MHFSLLKSNFTFDNIEDYISENSTESLEIFLQVCGKPKPCYINHESKMGGMTKVVKKTVHYLGQIFCIFVFFQRPKALGRLER